MAQRSVDRIVATRKIRVGNSGSIIIRFNIILFKLMVRGIKNRLEPVDCNITSSFGSTIRYRELLAQTIEKTTHIFKGCLTHQIIFSKFAVSEEMLSEIGSQAHCFAADAIGNQT